MAELKKKIKELKVPEAEDKKLQEKYKGDMEKAINKLIAASAKEQEFVKKLDMGKVMKD